MYAAESFVLRASIVLGLVAAVMTILYFTPYPDEYFLNCDRPCHELDWPMICRVQLTLEPHPTPSYCQECVRNNLTCDPKLCPMEDGKIRSTLTANLQVPGPAIQVCHNDILVVDVINKIPGKGLTIHWRGQTQNESPFMDGVPMITQCPISSFTAFQYKFRATAAGTHLWHAHSGSDVLDGFHGALIIRQADRVDPQKKYYDYDDKDHVIVISESTVEVTSQSGNKYILPKALLINGKLPPTPDNSGAVFKVKKGKRYRFRMLFSGAIDTCPVTVRIDQHVMKVIALDGNPVKAHEISSITFSKGERVDFVIKAKQNGGAFPIRIESKCNTNEVHGHGLIQYEHEQLDDKPEQELTDLQELVNDIPTRNFNTEMCDSSLGNICASSVSALKKIPVELRGEDVDKKFYLGFDYQSITPYVEGSTEKPDEEEKLKIYRMNNITFTYPSSPLLTQYSDVSPQMICSSQNLPKKCVSKNICECVHVEEIQLGATVELIIIDQAGDSNENIFHLHGYKFYVVGYKHQDKPITLEMAQSLDSEGKLVKRNLQNPVLKDTVRIPKYGAVAIRFQASNPGYWMLRDENSNKWSRGLDMIFKVGGTCDVPAAPSSFPQCGSWVGPDFFLL